jgi:hypothetical protein
MVNCLHQLLSFGEIMSISLITPATTITVSDHRNLLASWRRYDVLSRTLIGRYVVEKPLTDAQLRRLPGELRARVEC